MQRIRGIFQSKLVAPARDLVTDLRRVGWDFVQDVNGNQPKAALIAGTLFSIGWMNSHNPDVSDYKASVLEAHNELSLLPLSTRNPVSMAYTTKSLRHIDEGTVRRVNLFVCSLLMSETEKPQVNLYKVQHPIRVEDEGLGITKLFDSVMDIGFMGRFYLLEQSMVDFDVAW